jgi:TonB family protein
MSTCASTLRKPDQCEVYVKKFRSLFDMHHVGFGTPEEFPAFMQKLIQDRHFAMDFWALTGNLSLREGGELSVEEMLSVIVDAVIGGEIPGDDAGLKTLVDELASLLAGVDLYSPSRFSDEDETETDDSSVSAMGTRSSQTKFTDMTERAASDVRGASDAPAPSKPNDSTKIESSPKAESIDAESIEDELPPPITRAQHKLDEVLMRLEMKEIELKEHLEDLDKKVSRIEPRLEELTSEVYSTQRMRPAVEPVGKPVERPVHRYAENPRLVLESREEAFADHRDDAFTRGPLSAYATRTNRNGIMVAMIILFVLVVTGLFLQQSFGSSIWQRAGETLRDKYDMVRGKMHSSNAGQVAVNTAVTPNSVPDANAALASAGGPASSSTAPPSIQTTLPDSSPVQPAVEHAASVRSSSVPPSPVQSDKASSRAIRNPTRVDDAEEVVAKDRPLSAGETANAVKVAPAVMEANLLASRVPVYPEVAKEDHIEGSVVVQALIAKDGSVNRVHVIEGNSRLRNAAAEAVQKWRYKPYLLNGHPVEVATTITVDFSLDEQ